MHSKEKEREVKGKRKAHWIVKVNEASKTNILLNSHPVPRQIFCFALVSSSMRPIIE